MDFFKVRVDCRDFSTSFILDMPESCTRICNVKLKFILSILTGETSRETDPFTILQLAMYNSVCYDRGHRVLYDFDRGYSMTEEPNIFIF